MRAAVSCGLMHTSSIHCHDCSLWGRCSHRPCGFPPNSLFRPEGLAPAVGNDVRISLVADTMGSVITPSVLLAVAWGGMDAQVAPAKWSSTPFCLPRGLRMEPCQPILIFGSASCLALVCPLPRSKNYSNALPRQLEPERNMSRIPHWPLWAV